MQCRILQPPTGQIKAGVRLLWGIEVFGWMASCLEFAIHLLPMNASAPYEVEYVEGHCRYPSVAITPLYAW